MTGFDYGSYLASREWALLREQVRHRSHGICERCYVRPHEDTHHLTYERKGLERLTDLQGVCRPCHEFLSGKRPDDPVEEGSIGAAVRDLRAELLQPLTPLLAPPCDGHCACVPSLVVLAAMFRRSSRDADMVALQLLISVAQLAQHVKHA